MAAEPELSGARPRRVVRHRSTRDVAAGLPRGKPGAAFRTAAAQHCGRRPSLLCAPRGVVHETASVELLRRKLVVNAAQQTTAIDVVNVRVGESVDMVELEPARLRTSVAVLVDK